MKKKILFVALMGIIVTGCSKKSESCFTPSSTAVDVNTNVTFSDCSVDAVEYKWDFGDGGTSTEKSPTHSYSSAGTYSVKLTTTSKKGKNPNETSKSIKVNEVNAKFIGSYTVSESFTTTTGGSGSQGYNLTITAGNTSNQIILNNLNNGFSNVVATVAGSSFTIVPQGGVYNTGGGNYWDIDSGSGTLTGSSLSFNITADDYNYDNVAGYIYFTSTGLKQ